MSENSKAALVPHRPPVRTTGRPFSMTNCEGVPARVVPVPRVRGDARVTVPAGAGPRLRGVVGEALSDRGGRPPRAHISAHLRSKRLAFPVKSRPRSVPHNLPGVWGENLYRARVRPLTPPCRRKKAR